MNTKSKMNQYEQKMIFGLGRKLIILVISVIFILIKNRHKIFEEVVKNSSTSDEQRPSTGLKIQAQTMLCSGDIQF